MFKRFLLWTGLFCAGLLIGFEIAWFTGFLQVNRSQSAPSQTHGAVTITLSATIDGSDRFVFTRDAVVNEHGRWSPPKNILFNVEPWEDLSQPPAGWAELAAKLDLEHASLVSREGRDLIALELTADGFVLCFADTQMGAGPYSATISIPQK